MLSPGTRLGPYAIVAPLGRGGMGEVYKATDTRLDRTVAIKVVAGHMVADAASRERFDREARAISKLDHPHICPLFDVGHESGIDFLVMPCLDGQSLDERLKKGAIPIREALRYAIQIADALSRAHREGIVHRDLKPGNVMLTKAGPKLLDFGLAKSVAPAMAGAADASIAVTQDPGLSGQGILLGTLPYMAPEQIDGRRIDERTDIFAFGALLYEMATGSRAFAGENRSGLIVTILDRDPARLSELVPSIPRNFERTVTKCLAKEPDDRWQTARDLLDELQWIESSWDDGARAPTRRRLGRVKLAAMACAAGGVIAVSAGFGYVARSQPERPIIRFPILPGDIEKFGDFSISPDGKRLAFVGTAGQVSQLWVRPFGETASQPLPGTADPHDPFWSPDSEWVAFFADGKLKKTPVAGGPPQTICDAPNGRGGSWGTAGVIVFAPNILGPLSKVAAIGGSPTPLAPLDLARREDSHRRPFFLPDGRHFMFTARSNERQLSGVDVTSIDGAGRTRILDMETAAAYAAPGYVLFLRDGTRGGLMALPFDAGRRRVTGEAFVADERIPFELNAFAVSNGGVLTYRTRPQDHYVWFDRSGNALSPATPPGNFGKVRLSPDGTRAIVGRVLQGNSRVWVVDLSRGTMSRLTSKPAGDADAVWSPDGERMAFRSSRDSTSSLYLTDASNSGREEVLLNTDTYEPADWSSDGRFMLLEHADAVTLSDIWALPMTGDRKPFPILHTEFHESEARFSSDGRWMAYKSNESGRWEVYVQGFPQSTGRWQISTEGGAQPQWRRDGREIFYVDSKGILMSVPITLGAKADVGKPRPLFQSHLEDYAMSERYSVTADGQRFLINVRIDDENSKALTVVVNWTAALTGKR